MKSFFPFRCTLLFSALAAPVLASAAEAPAAPALGLDALVAEIEQRHPELRFYEAEIAAARAGVKTAGAPADPTLAVEAGRKRVHDAAGAVAGEGAVWSVTLTQSFEWPGRLALRKALANREVELAELGLERFRAALRARARTLAGSLAAAERRAATVAEVAERFAALKEVLLARDPAGLTPELEARVIAAQELVLRRRATEAELALRTALAELNQLRGRPADAPLRVRATPPEIGAVPALSALLAAAREKNFAFRAARLEVDRQLAAARLARHERRPAVELSPFVSRERAGDRETVVGLGVSVPLAVTRRASAGVALAESRRDQAEAAQLAAERAMELEVFTVAQTLEAKLAELQRHPADELEKFRAAAGLADGHYRLGAVPLATYVELQAAYLDAAEALLDTEREAVEAAGKLAVLTGVEVVRMGPEVRS